MNVPKTGSSGIINPAIGTGLKHYLSIASVYGDAVLDVAVYSTKTGGYTRVGNSTGASGSQVVSLKDNGSEFSYLMGSDVRKVAIKVVSATEGAAIVAETIATRVAA